ncbi:S8 family serine peptidase, partial [bacterium]|nr:S8 family serine peptidase [bacterium]
MGLDFNKFLNYFFTSLLTVFLLINCGGGGGGGGGAASSVNYTSEYNNQPGLAMIGASTANDAGYTGDGVTVAVVDTGIDSDHSDLSGRYSSTKYNSFGLTAFADVHGHGTHVAGIIAANKDGTGMRGVAYGSTIYSNRIFDNSGTMYITTDTGFKNLTNGQANTQNVDFSNNSWGHSTI